MQARYTDPSHQTVCATIDGAKHHGIRLEQSSELAAKLMAWIADGGVIEPYAPPPVDLLNYAADKRWQKEVGGIEFGGIPVATDDRSKSMIIGARLAADADPAWSTMWVGADGVVYPIDAAAIVAISDAVQAHVNACFTLYAAVKAGIDDGDVTSAEQIDTAFS